MLMLLWTWTIYITGVLGHGKLWEPPSRSSMWRRGFNTPRNPNDNELNCGGFENHWVKYGGRCGVCGDPFQQIPRPNEAGGVFAKGVITRHYQRGQIIDLSVDVTANHVGYFEFRLCPNNDITKPVTQKCLDEHPVFIVGFNDGRYHVATHQNGIVSFKGRLPKDVVCSQCVLQWRYRTGNRWGCDQRTGKCGKGYGSQEEFYGCSDISIGDGAPVSKQNTARKPIHVRPKPKEEMKSGFHLLANPSELIQNLGRDKSVKPVFEKLTSVLWTLLQTVASTNKNSRLALVQWNPIGHDLVDLAKPNHLPLYNINDNRKYKRPSEQWPPSKPTIIHADIGDPEGGPMMLSEVVVDDDWRKPTIVKKYTDDPGNVVPSESECHATKEFEIVQGTDKWCSVNCNAGNCPTVMCICTLHPSRAMSSDHSEQRRFRLPNRSTNNLHKALPVSLQKSPTTEVIENVNHKIIRLLSNKDDPTINEAVPTQALPKAMSSAKSTITCKGAGKFSTHENMVGWCLENCSKGFCPKTICDCSK